MKRSCSQKQKQKRSSNITKKLQKYIRDTEKDWNYITPTDFYHKYYDKKKILIDLRKKTDYDKFHIKDSINIFWLDLLKEESMKKIPKNKKIFLICYVGHTSSQAMVLLKLLGYNVTSIKYGYGVSPISTVPVEGWLGLNFPVVNNNK